jgi:hypothetical protein
MITTVNKANKQYNTHELCQLLKLSRSSYYDQIKPKLHNDKTVAMIESIKQIALEVGHTYGKRRMRIILNQQGYKIGIYRTASLMKKANVLPR